MTLTPILGPMEPWLQEARSYRHSVRAIILVGLEDGTFAILDDHNPFRRDAIHCTTLAEVEKYAVDLRNRELIRNKPQVINEKAAEAMTLLKSLGLL